MWPKMTKPKRKLTPAEKAEKKKRRLEYMTVLVNGKQKRVKRSPTIEGIDVEEFIRRNADPIWLHQNEMWEYMNTDVTEEIDGEDPSDVPL
jgi:16S rRNA U516 pseudouridylate synthase RsuA-like enzyme